MHLSQDEVVMYVGGNRGNVSRGHFQASRIVTGHVAVLITLSSCVAVGSSRSMAFFIRETTTM